MTNDDTDCKVYNSFFEDEVLALKSIYEDKLIIEKKDDSATLSMMLYPATADDVKSQYVCLLLKFSVQKEYPQSPVGIHLQQSRGLSDEQLRKISSQLTNHAVDNVGMPVLFDLIEMAKDLLTSNNVPSCPCPVCLDDFQDFDDFLKTECYHYLHSYCMYQYVVHWKEESKKNSQSLPPYFNHVPGLTNLQESALPCPVCRKPISYDLAKLSCSTKPIKVQTDVLNFDRIKDEMKKMQKLYQRQKEKGGIIDLEAEKNKYLLSNIAQAYAASTSSSNASIRNQDEEVSGLCNDAHLKASKKPVPSHPKSRINNPKSCDSHSKSYNLNDSSPLKSQVLHTDSQLKSFDSNPKLRNPPDDSASQLKPRDSSRVFYSQSRNFEKKNEKNHHRKNDHSKRHYNDKPRQERPVSRETHFRNTGHKFASHSSGSSNVSLGSNKLHLDKHSSNRLGESFRPRRAANDGGKYRPKQNSTSKSVSSFSESRTKASFGKKDIAE